MKKNDKIPQFNVQAFVWGIVAVLSTVGMYTQLF